MAEIPDNSFGILVEDGPVLVNFGYVNAINPHALHGGSNIFHDAIKVLDAGK